LTCRERVAGETSKHRVAGQSHKCYPQKLLFFMLFIFSRTYAGFHRFVEE
jgi:hypothetical protein